MTEWIYASWCHSPHATSAVPSSSPGAFRSSTPSCLEMVQWKVIALCGLVLVAAAAAVGRSGPQEQSEIVPALKPLVAAPPLEKVEADLGQPTAAPPAKCCACSWDQLALHTFPAIL